MTRRRSSQSVAAGRDAGRRRGRDVRAPGARGDRLRGRRPRRRARRADREVAGTAQRRDRRPSAGRQRACGAAIETPLGPLLGGLAAARLARARTGSTSSSSSCRSSAAIGRPAGLTLPRSAAVRRAAAADRRPVGRIRRASTGGRPAPERARLSDRQPRPAWSACRRRTVRGSRCSTTRPTGSAGSIGELDRVALPPRGARGRDAAPPLRAAGAAVRRRAAPLPALASCPATTRTRELAGVFYLFLRGMTGAETPVIDGARAACSPGGRHRALVGGAQRRPRHRGRSA